MISNAVRFLPAVPALASMMLAAGAAQAQSPVPGQGQSQHPTRGSSWEESGEASWYGGRHNGRRTSSGTVFNDREMTAAHATLPLGTKVRVTVQDTGESVVVTVTDRQPPKRVRVIDLSRGAASRVGILSRGTAMVTLAPARPGDDVEVAEAPDTAVGTQPLMSDAARFSDGATPRFVSGAALRRHGQPRTRLGVRAAAAARPCCRAPSVVQVRRSARPLAAPRTL